ncbi:Pheromone-processing carboxypeptidase KEX1; AltName: Full=Carboxypeptidase D; Flags: Precursor [Serendipita indica DSM 11827]|uniref:Pheromone-processing carboxypeptidase KEX1 n=1 Tax=Serendipita indica (strain DSM 11827) TaxID=1109443 RepID=G4TS42_SERID|nr:Pheromone-processing carboxypeptidase KEX1; AltName: Full=Carboxypeptidase D; Flags: Precursor [Serendipita indica DSM 11827]CCA74135.1 related to KEX1 protein precursor [Serendipita indica DSM 11827]
MEVGPWRMDSTGELREIEGGWEEYANIVYVDQPVGTGFSYGSTDRYATELTESTPQMIEFMRNFYKVFPELAGIDTYLAGESFAGQYIPYIADAMLKASNMPAPLRGIAIGNGWIDSRAQYPAYVEFGLKAGLFKENSNEHKHAKKKLAECEASLDKLPSSFEPVGDAVCEHVMGAVLEPFNKEVNGRQTCMNVYDIRLTDDYPACGMNWPPDLKQITPWLRKKPVVISLHAEAKDAAWTECSGRVGSIMSNKKSPSSVTLLPGLLEKISVMLFAGDQDVICNYVGQEKLLERLRWGGAVGMGNAESLPWTVNGTAAGTWQTARNMTYVKIFKGSHMVGWDLPHVVHDMILRFMNVDFGRITTGTAGRIPSSLGDTPKETPLPGGGTLSDLELKAKWQGAPRLFHLLVKAILTEIVLGPTLTAYYNAGTVALIVVLIAVSIGTVLYCRSRRNVGPSRIVLRDDNANGTTEESIPLTLSSDESRRRKGKGRAIPEPIEEEEEIFEIGSDGEEKYPS